MRAVVFHEFGNADVLRVEELPEPTPGAGEVVVEVTASALNHLDVDVREGVSRFPIEFPHTVGVEPVGRISALGAGRRGLGGGRPRGGVPDRDVWELQLLPYRP